MKDENKFLHKYLFCANIFMISLFCLQGCNQYRSLTIIEYGPQNVKANVPFNVQKKTGESALWFKLNRGLEGEAYVMINGVRLSAIRRSNVVTVEVPSFIFNKPGNYPMYVVELIGTHTVKSNQVSFVVF
jgi:hypothetical protein